MRSILLVNFSIVLTIASILSAVASMQVLYRAYSDNNFSLKVEKANSTIEAFRWTIETEIEEFNYYTTQGHVIESDTALPAIEAGLLSMRFLENETVYDEGDWVIFFEKAKEYQKALGDPDLEQEEKIETLSNVKSLLQEYGNMTADYVSEQRQLAEDKQGMVSTIVLGIFFIHIVLFVISVRVDLLALLREQTK